MAHDVTAAALRAARHSDPAAALRRLLKTYGAVVVLRALASLQDGQFATAQAHALGLTRNALQWMRRTGQIVAVARGVWRFASAANTADAGVTAFLRCWPGGVVSHETAAAFHTLPVTLAATPHVTVTRDRRGCAIAGAEVHVTRTPLDADRIWSGAVAYTTLARTVCDLAESRTQWEGLTLVDDAIALGATRTWLHSRASALATGRGGATLVRDATAPGAQGVFRSWLERTAAHVILAGHLPDPVWNVRVRDDRGLIGIADALFEPWRVIAELEGMRFHTKPSQRKKDAERFNRYADAAYAARRFTWLDVVERPVYVVTALARPLIAAGAAVDLARIPQHIAIPDHPYGRSRSGVDVSGDAEP